MAEKIHRVVFQPDGRTLHVPDGETLLDAAQAAGIAIEATCGGNGICGGCRVIIPDHPPPPSEACQRELTVEELAGGFRLACQIVVHGNLCVIIPAEPPPGDQKILAEGADRPVPLAPNVRKVSVHVPQSSVDDQRADAERLVDALAEKGIADLAIDVTTIRDLPHRLRSFDFHPAVVIIGDEIVHLDRATSADACYGVALDVGTTTIAGYLVDLTTGKVASVAGRANPQAAHGDDAIARIEYCGRVKTGARTLQSLVVGAINEIVAEACRRASIKPTAVYEATVVGNTAMNHLLLRLPVDPISRAPFVAASSSALVVQAADLGLKIHPQGRVYTAPLVAGFVGADTVGVILATGMHKSDRLRLAIDIGTSGEIILGTRERLLACRAAARPALEGARIRYGMRATTGAIDRVDLVGDRLVLHTIDEAPPVGICGTGLIDVVAALLDAGVIGRGGLIKPAEELKAVSPQLAGRVTSEGGETGFLLAGKDETDTGQPILLMQKDIREVQLAKGAIAAGTQTLIEEFGATVGGIDEVLLAGAFGNTIRPDRALAIGLLPQVPAEKVRFVGNAAGGGARMLLVNRDLRRVADDVARGIEHIELSQRPDFPTRFADAMLFPSRA